MSSYPTDRMYSKTHEWFLVKGDTVTIGITQHAADELTDITFVDLPPVGTRIAAESAAGEIESVKTTSELFSVVGGEVVEVNAALADAPDLVNSDPFGKGWMLRLRITDAAPLSALMNADAYDRYLAEA